MERNAQSLVGFRNELLKRGGVWEKANGEGKRGHYSLFFCFVGRLKKSRISSDPLLFPPEASAPLQEPVPKVATGSIDEVPAGSPVAVTPSGTSSAQAPTAKPDGPPAPGTPEYKALSENKPTETPKSETSGPLDLKAAGGPVKFDQIRPDDNTGLKTVEMPDNTKLADQSRLNSPDAATGKTRPGQADAAAGLEKSLGEMRPAEKGEKGDFIISDGPNEGKSVDFTFTTDSTKVGQMQNKYFDQNWSGTQKQILDHVKKADVVPMDLRGLDANAKAKVTDFVKQLPPESKAKIVLLQ